MAASVETFRKEERLCSRKAIADLFDSGKSFYGSSFQVIWLESTMQNPFPAQMAISVSKKVFRRAVKRNLIKRRIREAYRKNKDLLYEYLNKENKKVIFMLIYKGDSIPDYIATEKSVKELIRRLISEVKKSY